DRQRRAGCAARLEQSLELLVEVAGVVETGEIVVHGELAEALLVRAQRFLRALAVGGVDAGREDLDQLSPRADDRRVAPRDPETPTIARHVLVLVVLVALRLAQDVLDHRDEVAARRLLGIRN